jgi:hypothetical protein
MWDRAVGADPLTRTRPLSPLFGGSALSVLTVRSRALSRWPVDPTCQSRPPTVHAHDPRARRGHHAHDARRGHARPTSTISSGPLPLPLPHSHSLQSSHTHLTPHTRQRRHCRRPSWSRSCYAVVVEPSSCLLPR